jgi:hypothetical protein
MINIVYSEKKSIQQVTNEIIENLQGVKFQEQ